jgi:hypothetical protein
MLVVRFKKNYQVVQKSFHPETAFLSVSTDFKRAAESHVSGLLASVHETASRGRPQGLCVIFKCVNFQAVSQRYC